MNSCILMAEIIQEPELRYTSDTQTPITELLVQFPGLRSEDSPATLKVIGWGNLAQEIQAHYHQGDRVVIEGRLNMNTIERPEGFKEKRAELTAQRIHRLASDTLWEPAVSASPPLASSSPASEPTSTGTQAPRSTAAPKAKSSTAKFASPPEPIPEANLDDIPF